MKTVIDSHEIGSDCATIGNIAHKLRRAFLQVLTDNAHLKEKVDALEKRLAAMSEPETLTAETDQAPRMLSQREVMKRWSVGKSTYYEMRKNTPNFPKPVFKGSPIRFWLHEIEIFERDLGHNDR